MNSLHPRTAKEDEIDKRDHLFSKTYDLNDPSQIKTKVDLRTKISSPIINQGLLNSCSACALSVAVEINFKKKHHINHINQKPITNASQMFIYYNERVIENKVNINTGVYIRDGIKSLVNNGVCSEELWPYPTIPLPNNLKTIVQQGDDEIVITKIEEALKDHAIQIQEIVSRKPSLTAIEQANNNKISKYHKLSISNGLDELKLCLSKGIPVVFGINEPESFFTTPPTGQMKIPPLEEMRLGGHCLIAVGYDDEKEIFIVRNSYGENFADKGYCYMPYDFITGFYIKDKQKINNTFSFWCLPD